MADTPEPPVTSPEECNLRIRQRLQEILADPTKTYTALFLVLAEDHEDAVESKTISAGYFEEPATRLGFVSVVMNSVYDLANRLGISAALAEALGLEEAPHDPTNH